MSNDDTENLLKTPLYSLHAELGARLVPFAGYVMPVQYPSGILREHEHTRKSAGLFDISHMGQIKIIGDDTAVGLEALVPGDIESLGLYRQRYTVFTNETGGIRDDLMITHLPDCYYLVVNAACKTEDYEYLVDSLGENYQVLQLDKGLIALQGPMAADVLSEHDSGLVTMPFMSAVETSISGIDCLIHRCGYTGEDGFEISVASEDVETLARSLLQDERVAPAGLGARDTLRLEAGLCLYGHDLDENTTPVEADLAWTIAKKYRSDTAQRADFPGAEIILSQLKSGPPRIRRGFMPEGRMPVREGTMIYHSDGEKAGIITSGGYGQTIGKPVSMGYVIMEYDNLIDYTVKIRNQSVPVKKTELPFVRHRYYRN